MPRYAPRISKEDFLATVKSYGVAREWDEEWGTEDTEVPANVFIPNGLIEEHFTDALNDLRKIDFDWENCEVEQYITLNSGVTVALLYAGGDWELPVYFAFYYDGKKFRAYMPSKSNVYNHTTKQAYGNDEDKDNKDAKKRYGVDSYYDAKPDMGEIIAEIEGRIEARGSIGAVDFENTEEVKARKARKQHLLDTEPDFASMDTITPEYLVAEVHPAAGGAYFQLKTKYSEREITVEEGRKVVGIPAGCEVHEVTRGTLTWYPPQGISSKDTAKMLEDAGFEIDETASYLDDYRQMIIRL